jgi:hypothetical protein
VRIEQTDKHASLFAVSVSQEDEKVLLDGHLVGVLTDEGLGVVASDVVPLDAVLIDVV